MFRKFRLLLCLYVFLFGSTALAGTVVEFTILGEGVNEQQTASISDGLIYVENAGGLPDSDLLFDAGKNEVVMINHLERSYYTLDEKELDDLAALAASLATTVNSQKEVLADILGTVGLESILKPEQKEGEQPADKRLEDVERQMTISGLRCDLYRIWRKGELDTEICIAGQSTFPIAVADYDTLKELYRFGDKVFDLAGELLVRLGVPIPMLGSDELEGLPVFIHSHKEGMRTFVERIGAYDIDSSKFTIPAGYEKTVFPMG